MSSLPIRRLALPILTAVIAAASACLQPSLNPLFLPEDSVFEEGLLGTWVCGDETWTFEKQTEKDLGPKPFYKVTMSVDQKKYEIMAWLGRIDDHTFVNFRPETDPDLPTFVKAHFVGTYSFGRAWIDPDRIKFGMLSSGFLQKLEESGQLTIGVKRWPEDVILTATPKELQRFAGTFAEESDIFGEPIELVKPGTKPSGADNAVGHCYSEK